MSRHPHAPYAPLHARWLRGCQTLVPVLLAVASGSAAAQLDTDAADPSRMPSQGIRLSGAAEGSRLPRIDMALLSPLATAVADPVQLAQRAQGVAPNEPLNLGLHWRPRAMGGFSVQASVWRRISQDRPTDGDAAEPIYGAQVELELRRDPRAALRDLLGMKMDNGGRISLRPRKNAVTIYYKVSF